MRPQVVDLPTLPTRPLRETIVDEWLEPRPIHMIAARHRISGETVQMVLRFQCEIWHRQAVASRMEPRRGS